MINRLLLISLFLLMIQWDSNAQVVKETTTKKNSEKIVYIYGSANCHYCSDAKNILEKNKVEFVFYDIDTDKNALKEMLFKLKKANQSTMNLGIPVVDRYGEIFSNNSNFDDFLKRLIQ